MVRDRKIEEIRQWVLKSHVGTHTCIPPDKADRSKGHRQLTSEYLEYKLLNPIAHDPTVKVKFLMSLIEEQFGHPVKYGKAWMPKANGYSKKGFKEAWRKSVVKKRGWSGSNARRRGHAKRNLLVRRRGQESLQRLARCKRRTRHVTRRGNGLALLSRDFASVHSSSTIF